MDPGDDRVRRAVALVRDNCRWENDGQPFFEGEVEPCINGMVVAWAPTSGRTSTAWSTACRRAARGRRLELRGRERLGPRVVQHDDPRARRAARARAGNRWISGRPRRPAEGRGVPARAEAPPAQEHGRGDRPRVRCSSPIRPAGTTTCCGASTTSAPPAGGRTIAQGRRSSWSARSGNRTAPGCSRTRTRARSTSRWTPATVSPAAGTRLRALRVLRWSDR